MRNFLLLSALFLNTIAFSQPLAQWINVDQEFQPLPSSVHIFYTNKQIDTGKFKAYYLIADLKAKDLNFDVDTTLRRRLTPTQFFERGQEPLVVVNASFFSFETNQNLNVIVQDGALVGYNLHSMPGRGEDTFTYRHPFGSAIGISKKRDADVAWVWTDSSSKVAYASQVPRAAWKDSINNLEFPSKRSFKKMKPSWRKWKMETAIGGGPVLIQDGEIKISNNEEIRFAGKAIADKHPRTAMGYTADDRLIILMIEGRNPEAGGATLTQVAQLLKDLGCIEAINLDGGGSSCMLINGKSTIKVSDKDGQRPVPAVFIINTKK